MHIWVFEARTLQSSQSLKTLGLTRYIVNHGHLGPEQF